MKLHTPPFVSGDAVQNPALREDFYIKAGFFFDLSHTGLFEVFAQMNPAARNTPSTYLGRLPPTNDENVFVLEDDGPYADNRAKRIFPTQSLISLLERQRKNIRFWIATVSWDSLHQDIMFYAQGVMASRSDCCK